MSHPAARGPRYRQLPLWRDAQRFLLEVELAVRAFPRYHKYTLGSDLRRQAMDVNRLVARAAQQGDAVRRVALLTSEQSNSVKLTFAKNKLEISAVTPDVGEAHESMDVKHAGKSLTVSFNPEFLIDPLRDLAADSIFLELTDEISPGVIRSNDPFLYVIMPMRMS